MTGRLRRWQALSWSDRACLILMMTIGLPAISAALRLFGYVRTRRWLESTSAAAVAREPTAHELARAENLGLLANIAGRNGPISATCLRQSLLIYWLLRRHGLQPTLKIGVCKEPGEFLAHAWVEVASQALAQDSLRHQAFRDTA